MGEAGPQERHGDRSTQGKVCSVCGDPEPKHVHHEGRRIEGYFTVGRGETDFEAAQSWQRRAAESESTVAQLREAGEDVAQSAHSLARLVMDTLADGHLGLSNQEGDFLRSAAIDLEATGIRKWRSLTQTPDDGCDCPSPRKHYPDHVHIEGGRTPDDGT